MQGAPRITEPMDRRWIGRGLLAGLAVWGGWNQRQAQRLGHELEVLRSADAVLVDQGSMAHGAPVSDPGAERVAAELSALRGEVVALRKRVEERLRPEERGQASAGVGAGREREEVGLVAKSVPGYVRSGWVDRSGIPNAVLDGFRQQLGDVVIEGAHMKQSGGRLFYSMESKTPEGRGVEVSLDQSGAIVRLRRELELTALSEGIQATVMQAVGEVPIQRVAEVFEDGQIGYRVHAKAPNQSVELVLNREGQVLRSETTVRETKP